MGALFALQEMGVAVPKEMSVCGFDDSPQARQTWPGLSTVHHPIDKIVDKATGMLLTILAGDELETRQMVLPSRLVLRQSIAPPIPEVD
jgi:DNA-binding LacI/PurR family transcriptional regulator